MTCLVENIPYRMILIRKKNYDGDQLESSLYMNKYKQKIQLMHLFSKCYKKLL